MAPIYESDIAEQRWARAEWEHYELWEKLEVKLRRRRRLWIAGTMVLFLALSSVPIIRERLPAWRGQEAARLLAEQLNRIKADSAITRFAYQLSFPDPRSLDFTVERLDSCSHPTTRIVERTGRLAVAGSSELTLASGGAAGTEGMATSFCYDPYQGAQASLDGRSMLGFAVAPVKDLAEHRLDRMTVMLVSGESADISFE